LGYGKFVNHDTRRIDPIEVTFTLDTETEVSLGISITTHGNTNEGGMWFKMESFTLVYNN